MPPTAPPNNNTKNNAIPPGPPRTNNPTNSSLILKLSKSLFLILILTLLALHIIGICMQVYFVRDLIVENEILKNLNEAKTMEVLWWKEFRVEKFNPLCRYVLFVE